MAPFEPELERNRREYEDVGMKKIQATVWLFFGLIVSGGRVCRLRPECHTITYIVALVGLRVG